MERKVGETFKVNGCTYVVVPDPSDWMGCKLCVCRQICKREGRMVESFGECAGWKRSDHVEVHFENFGVKWRPD